MFQYYLQDLLLSHSRRETSVLFCQNVSTGGFRPATDNEYLGWKISQGFMDPTVWRGFAVQVSSRNKGNSKKPTALLSESQDKDGKSLSNFK